MFTVVPEPAAPSSVYDVAATPDVVSLAVGAQAATLLVYQPLLPTVPLSAAVVAGAVLSRPIWALTAAETLPALSGHWT